MTWVKKPFENIMGKGKKLLKPANFFFLFQKMFSILSETEIIILATITLSNEVAFNCSCVQKQLKSVQSLNVLIHTKTGLL